MVRHTLARIGGELVLTAPKTAGSRDGYRCTPGLWPSCGRTASSKSRNVYRPGISGPIPVLCSLPSSGRWSTQQLLRTVEIAARKAGIEAVGAHSLRHSAAVAWLESGVHIKAAADLLGHPSIAVTGDLYGHTSDNTARAAVDGLGATLGL